MRGESVATFGSDKGAELVEFDMVQTAPHSSLILPSSILRVDTTLFRVSCMEMGDFQQIDSVRPLNLTFYHFEILCDLLGRAEIRW